MKITKKRIIISCIVVFVILVTVVAILVGTTINKKLNYKKIEETEIRSICELATLKAYYHNVAKAEKDKSSGLKGLGEKDREFWIEYEGYATIGIDMQKVNMKIKGDKVTITMPRAEVLDTNITTKTNTKDLKIVSNNDAFINKNKISTEDRRKAIEAAQKNMKKSVEKNKSLLNSAELRAQELIENYINQLGMISEIDYEITWNYLE